MVPRKKKLWIRESLKCGRGFTFFFRCTFSWKTAITFHKHTYILYIFVENRNHFPQTYMKYYEKYWNWVRIFSRLGLFIPKKQALPFFSPSLTLTETFETPKAWIIRAKKLTLLNQCMVQISVLDHMVFYGSNFKAGFRPWSI
jgi:hypothetical protein